MRKKIEYEINKIEDVVVDLADEVKNGWKIGLFGWPQIESSIGERVTFTVEVELVKEF